MRFLITLFVLFSLKSYGATSPEIQKYLTDVLKANDAVHSTFVKNDEAGLKSVWDNFDQALAKDHPSELKELITESQSASSKLKTAVKFTEKRKIYGDVIKPVVLLLQKYGPFDSYKVFTCPMVKKDWVQDIKVIAKPQNPFAPEMVNCGMMRE